MSLRFQEALSYSKFREELRLNLYDKHKTESSHLSASEEFKEFLVTIKGLICTPIYVGASLGRILDVLAFKVLSLSYHKELKTVFFRVSSSSFPSTFSCSSTCRSTRFRSSLVCFAEKRSSPFRLTMSSFLSTYDPFHRNHGRSRLRIWRRRRLSAHEEDEHAGEASTL